MKKGIAELLEEVSKIKKIDDRADALKNLASKEQAVAMVIEYIFNPNVKFDLPDGDPPYKPLPKESDVQNALYRDVRRLQYFIKDRYPQIKPLKRETMFIEMLEGVDPDDAALLIAMKDKKSPYKGIDNKLIHKAFPGSKEAGW